LSNMHATDFDTVRYDVPAVFLKWNRMSQSEIEDNNNRLQRFLRARINAPDLEVILMK